MKKIRIFAVMLCIATLGMMTSCSKDEDSIVGKWTVIEAGGQFTNAVTGEPEEVTYNWEGAIWEFTKEGKLISNYGSYDYKVDGKTLTIMWDNKSRNCTIEELSESKLRLTYAAADYALEGGINQLYYATFSR